MKKLILSLVLAAITLPAMAELSQSKINKINNAMSTLKGYGIDPVIVADDISDKLSLNYVWSGDWTDTLINEMEMGLVANVSAGSLILHEGTNDYYIDANVFDSDGLVRDNYDYNYEHYSLISSRSRANNSHYLFSSRITTRVGSSNDYKFSNGTSSFFVTNTMSSDAIRNGAEAWYDKIWDGLAPIGIHQNSDNISESLKYQVGDIIIDHAKELKDTIKSLAYQTAAAEIGKSMAEHCTTPEGAVISHGVCSAIGEQFLDISSNLAIISNRNDGYSLEGADYAGNNGFYSYLEERVDYWGNWDGVDHWSEPFSVYQKNSSGYVYTKEGLATLGTVTKKTAVDTYSVALDSISGIASAYSDLSNEEQIIYRTVTNSTTGIETLQTWVIDLEFDTVAAGWPAVVGDGYRRRFWNGTLGGVVKESVLINSAINNPSMFTVNQVGGIATFADVDWSI